MRLLRYIACTFLREVGVIGRVLSFVVVAFPTALAIAIGFFGGEWSRDQMSWWGWVVLVLVAVSGVLAFSMTKRAYRLDEERKPILKIDFIPSFCVEPFKEVDEDLELGSRYSIIVSNTSTVLTVNDVACVIKEIKDWSHTYPNAKLVPIQGPVSFRLAPGAKQIIRVCEALIDDDFIQLAYRPVEEIPVLPKKDFELLIEGHGNNTPTVSRWFNITMVDRDRIAFKPSE